MPAIPCIIKHLDCDPLKHIRHIWVGLKTAVKCTFEYLDSFNSYSEAGMLWMFGSEQEVTSLL